MATVPEPTHSLDALFNPRTIAVVGASPTEGKMGNLFVQHLRESYRGQIFPIHPRAGEICGLRAYQGLDHLPEAIDLLIPLIPADKLLPLVASCRQGQVRFLLAIPSGFAETSGGADAQAALLQLAAQRGMRMVGPNSVGLFNAATGLNASMMPSLPPGGAGLSCITQSGGFGMALSMFATDHELPVAKFCDLGNSADLAPHALLRYLRQDEQSHVVGAYLESTVASDAFVAEARLLARTKPLILCKLGQTAAGGRASHAHIGLPPERDEPLAALGAEPILAVPTAMDMMEVAKGLSWQPLPAGPRIAILTGSGGVGAELAELCVAHGLELPLLSPVLQGALAPHLPPYASVRNPVDLTPIWQEYPRKYPPLLRALLASEEVDMVLVAILDVATTIEPLMHALVEAVREARQALPVPKPVYVYWSAPLGTREHRQLLQRAQLPCYQSSLYAARSISAISRYAAARRAAGL